MGQIVDLHILGRASYADERSDVYELVNGIWKRPASRIIALRTIEEWYADPITDIGPHFWIDHEDETVGITGYFDPKDGTGDIGLRHHGTLVRGTGGSALEALIEHLETNVAHAKRLVELIPGGREELISWFERYGFEQVDRPIPEWDDENYYQYVMERRLIHRRLTV